MKNLLPLLLVLGGLALFFYGITLFNDSTASVKLLGMELGVSDEGMQKEAVLFSVLGIVSFAGGIFLMKKR